MFKGLLTFKQWRKNVSVLLSFSLLFCTFELYAERTEFVIELKNHLFYPAEIKIPAEQKVKLIIHNLDSSVEEFDSFSLNREKVIFPGQKAVIFIGPLPPGRYEFFGEYHPNSAKGIVVVGASGEKDAH